MTGIGSRTHGVSSALSPSTSLGDWIEAQIDSFLNFMTRVLCRASRGWLCPPDMTSVMYPDDAAGAGETQEGRRKGCCDENVSGK